MSSSSAADGAWEGRYVNMYWCVLYSPLSSFHLFSISTMSTAISQIHSLSRHLP
ncbi:hypothetical protein JCGZ_22126 [Jatropha curcas]|uniref:Uncharacterized protein n=1 Tax=Jatropha curcas TaxID=180498 RepID=A0A067LQB5_JATCU|nr:hypothetical protein JCGZ_22126 [Jatropha curcas]